MGKWIFILVLSCCLSCDDIVEIPDISAETVDILAPSNGTVLKDTEVTFTWESVTDAETYTLQVARPNFTNAAQIIVDTTISKTTFSKTLSLETYTFRVRAENSGYTTKYFESTFVIEE